MQVSQGRIGVRHEVQLGCADVLRLLRKQLLRRTLLDPSGFMDGSGPGHVDSCTCANIWQVTKWFDRFSIGFGQDYEH